MYKELIVVSPGAPCETILIATAEQFLLSSSFFFLFLSKNHLLKGSVCLSVKCVKIRLDAIEEIIIILIIITITITITFKRRYKTN